MEYAVTRKGQYLGVCDGASKAWAFEAWKETLTPSEVREYRGEAPRGHEELEVDPWDGIELYTWAELPSGTVFG